MKQPSYSIVPSAVDGRKCVPEEYQAAIPEAQNIVWDDDFFDDEVGIVAVFDYDYDQLVDYERFVIATIRAMMVMISAFYAVIFLGVYGAMGAVALMLLLYCPCLVHRQVRWNVHARHIAITRDGIRYVVDRRKNCWGFPMCDLGKYSRTIPFDQITDCEILEPAGRTCFAVKQVLYTVNVYTASSSSSSSGPSNNGVRHKLSISGLKEPHKFQALVLAMKRVHSHYVATAPTVLSLPIATAFPLAQLETELELVNKSTTGGSSPSCTDTTTTTATIAVTALLQSIREELRENNELLRKMNNSSGITQLSPPTGDMV